MRLTNVNGTSDNTCKCTSWLAHWEKYNLEGQKVPYFCPVLGCKNRAEIGAHVQRSSTADKSWYIVPLCAACNGRTGQSLEVTDSISLASANVSETCGKKSP